jgi:hypothetical protein
LVSSEELPRGLATVRAQHKDELARQLKTVEHDANELREIDAQLSQVRIKPKMVEETLEEVRGPLREIMHHPRIGHVAVFYYGAAFALVGSIGLALLIPPRMTRAAAQ